ncbi:hypothetical protein CO653_13035 [Rhizobium anhuiense]|uniref:hypothetical protein n=1 Tax=Rhizobium anhuiense TaxID=1184720 RepID=UPI000BE92536|nr:hypothetical protein [Rhizobium anhuiense]PDS65116.1 hypothetical protein CO653_13035 [Rhizobium anhuiense]
MLEGPYFIRYSVEQMSDHQLVIQIDRLTNIPDLKMAASLYIEQPNIETWVKTLASLRSPKVYMAPNNSLALWRPAYNSFSSSDELLKVVQTDIEFINGIASAIYGLQPVVASGVWFRTETALQLDLIATTSIYLKEIGSNFGRISEKSDEELGILIGKCSERVMTNNLLFDLLYWFSKSGKDWHANYCCAEAIIEMYGSERNVPDNASFKAMKQTANLYRHLHSPSMKKPLTVHEAYCVLRRHVIDLLIREA